MQTKIQYTVADDTTIYAEVETREIARAYLRDLKANGNKSVKIYQEEFARIASKQVR
jgi:hypothetical protein